MSGRVFDTEKHTNIKRRAEYRRIKKYYKGLAKAKAEKARRQRILDLQDKGLTIKQIAGQLNVSERTVKRDIEKMMPYLKKLQTQFIRKENEEFLQQLTAGLSLKKQFEAISKYLGNYRRICKPKDCRALQITIDLDSVLRGRYGVVFKPDLPVNMLENGRITLEWAAAGRKQAIARIYIGKVVWGAANLQTNDSMNQFVKPTLKGLRVVESTQSRDSLQGN